MRKRRRDRPGRRERTSELQAVLILAICIHSYIIGSIISMMLTVCHAYREGFEQGGKFDTRSLFAAADEVR